MEPAISKHTNYNDFQCKDQLFCIGIVILGNRRNLIKLGYNFALGTVSSAWPDFYFSAFFKISKDIVHVSGNVLYTYLVSEVWMHPTKAEYLTGLLILLQCLMPL